MMRGRPRERTDPMPLSTIDIALRGATVALLLVLAASLFRGFGTVLAGRLAAAFALGSAAHAVTYSIGVDVAGRGSACAADRAVDRQRRGVLAVHAGAVRRDVWAALVARADLGGGGGIQLRQLHVDGAGIRRAVFHHRGQPARARLHRRSRLRRRSPPGRRIWSRAAAASASSSSARPRSMVASTRCCRYRWPAVAAPRSPTPSIPRVLAAVVAAIINRDDARRRRRSVSGRARGQGRSKRIGLQPNRQPIRSSSMH